MMSNNNNLAVSHRFRRKTGRDAVQTSQVSLMHVDSITRAGGRVCSEIQACSLHVQLGTGPLRSIFHNMRPTVDEKLFTESHRIRIQCGGEGSKSSRLPGFFFFYVYIQIIKKKQNKNVKQ